ncbi:MAG: DoxX family protein [Armatimonadetes bacterium]|nr:DoxX family protein [Armatimonadota bacterium]
MGKQYELFERVDPAIVRWMGKNGISLLRISLGVVFVWFGVLKFFPGLSPAQELVGATISDLFFGAVTPDVSLPVLAGWECMIGIGLVTGRLLRLTLFLLFVQMPGTIAPLFMYPELCFTHPPFVPTIEGQYIIKNLVLVSAGIVVGATVRGGKIDVQGASRQATVS